MRRYWVEYDENSCVWLVDVADKARVPLEHGMLLDVALDVLQQTQLPPPP